MQTIRFRSLGWDKQPEERRQETKGFLARTSCRAGMPHLARDLVGTSKITDRSALHAKLVPVRPARRSRSTHAHCSQLPRIQLEEHNENNNGLPGLRAIAIVTACAHVLSAGEAQAWGPSWRPRRHHRRMNERSVDVKNFFQVCPSCIKAATYEAGTLRYTSFIALRNMSNPSLHCPFCRRTRCMSAWRLAHSQSSKRCAATSVHELQYCTVSSCCLQCFNNDHLSALKMSQLLKGPVLLVKHLHTGSQTDCTRH